MTIPKRKGKFETGPLRRPAGPAESEEPADPGAVDLGQKSWKSRFPGWETHEGRPCETRLEHEADPTHDFRYDTNLNPRAVVPRHLGLVVYVLGAVLCFLLLAGVGALLFYHFMQPSPGSPDAKLRSTSAVMNSTGNAVYGQRARTLPSRISAGNWELAASRT